MEAAQTESFRLVKRRSMSTWYVQQATVCSCRLLPYMKSFGWNEISKTLRIASSWVMLRWRCLISFMVRQSHRSGTLRSSAECRCAVQQTDSLDDLKSCADASRAAARRESRADRVPSSFCSGGGSAIAWFWNHDRRKAIAPFTFESVPVAARCLHLSGRCSDPVSDFMMVQGKKLDVALDQYHILHEIKTIRIRSMRFSTMWPPITTLKAATDLGSAPPLSSRNT